MFACERCNGRMDIEETSSKVDPGRCRRERQCPNPKCGYVCTTTEVSDAAYKTAVRKAAILLAQRMTADTMEILGVHVTKNGTGKERIATASNVVRKGLS